VDTARWDAVQDDVDLSVHVLGVQHHVKHGRQLVMRLQDLDVLLTLAIPTAFQQHLDHLDKDDRLVFTPFREVEGRLRAKMVVGYQGCVKLERISQVSLGHVVAQHVSDVRDISKVLQLVQERVDYDSLQWEDYHRAKETVLEVIREYQYVPQ
jgi:hypothetical protein